MFYEPQQGSGLPHNPFKACCVPRPIGWMSTVDDQGNVNLAPYSQFQNVTWDPPTVSVAVNCRPDGTPKDTALNAMATGEFGWSMATQRHIDAVIATNQPLPHGVDEFDFAGLEKKAAHLIAPPLVMGAPAHFECKLIQTVFLRGTVPEANTYLLIGEVIGIHIDDDYLTEGLLDVARIKPLARMGYLEFAVVEKALVRPDLLELAETVTFMRG